MRTTLGSNNTTFFQGSVQKLKVRLLEQRLCWTLRITAVGDDDVELVLAISQKLEAVSDMDVDIWVLVANGHPRQIFLADTNDCLVNVAKDSFLHGFMLDNLAQDTTVTTANNEH